MVFLATTRRACDDYTALNTEAALWLSATVLTHEEVRRLRSAGKSVTTFAHEVRSDGVRQTPGASAAPAGDGRLRCGFADGKRGDKRPRPEAECLLHVAQPTQTVPLIPEENLSELPEPPLSFGLTGAH
jgi:hypothetical protein